MVKTTVKIEGMMCENCERHMNEAFEKSFDIKEVNSSHDNAESVIISEGALDEEKIREVVADTGYTFKGVSSEEYKKKGLFGIFR